MDAPPVDLLALADAALSDRRTPPTEPLERHWIAGVTTAPAAAPGRIGEWSVTWEASRKGPSVDDTPNIMSMVGNLIVGQHAPPGTEAAVAVVDWMERERIRYAAVAVDLTGRVGVVSSSGGTRVVYDQPLNPAAVMLYAWLGCPAEMPDIPFRSVVAAAGLRQALVEFGDRVLARQEETTSTVTIERVDQTVVWAVDGQPVTISEAAAGDWDTFYDHWAHGRVRGTQSTLAEWLGPTLGFWWMVTYWWTPEAAAWVADSIWGAREARRLLNVVCELAGAPRFNPAFDITAEGYRHPDPGVAATASVGDPDWPVTLFGVPLNDDHYDELLLFTDELWQAEEMGGMDLRARMKQDERLTGTDITWVTVDNPGDIIKVRRSAIDPDLRAVHATAGKPEHDRLETYVSFVRRTALAYMAVPYFMPSATAIAVSGSSLPDTQINEWVRLPHRAVFVCFDHPLTLDDVAREQLDPLEGNPWVWDGEPQPDGPPLRWMAELDVTCGGWGTTLGELARHGGGLQGVVLTADPDGRLSPWVMWVFAVNHDPRNVSGSNPYRVAWGNLEHSTIGHVPRNLAAYCCWGDWTSPSRRLDLPPVDDNQAWRKLVRTSQFRKASLLGGAVEGLRIVAVKPPPAESRPATTTDRTVTPHLRRGHWHRFRTAVRDDAGQIIGDVHGEFGQDWTYKAQWIPPVAVKGSSGGTGRQSLYVLPSAAPPE